MTDPSSGRPINQITFDELQARMEEIEGWIYPRRNISSCIEIFPRTQQYALSLYVVVAISVFLAALILPFVFGNWWWLTLIFVASIIWKANRKSMEQFFLKNLQNEREFYDRLRASAMGNLVQIVFRSTS